MLSAGNELVRQLSTLVVLEVAGSCHCHRSHICAILHPFVSANAVGPSHALASTGHSCEGLTVAMPLYFKSLGDPKCIQMQQQYQPRQNSLPRGALA